VLVTEQRNKLPRRDKQLQNTPSVDNTGETVWCMHMLLHWRRFHTNSMILLRGSSSAGGTLRWRALNL